MTQLDIIFFGNVEDGDAGTDTDTGHCTYVQTIIIKVDQH